MVSAQYGLHIGIGALAKSCIDFLGLPLFSKPICQAASWVSTVFGALISLYICSLCQILAIYILNCDYQSYPQYDLVGFGAFISVMDASEITFTFYDKSNLKKVKVEIGMHQIWVIYHWNLDTIRVILRMTRLHLVP